MRYKHIITSVVVALSATGYVALGYFTPRADFFQLLTLFALLFAGYFLMIKWCNDWQKLLIAAAILFRLVLLFALPNLSDDFYRFIWDGRLLMSGENPFLHLPKEYILLNPELGSDIYPYLNSPGYFSVYPPIHQFIFGIGSALSPSNLLGSVVVMKCFILLAEIANLFLIAKLLEKFKLAKRHILLYALNPLVIIELCGNLHFEAIMLCFLLLTIWLLASGRIYLSALAFGLAVCTKLLPLIFLPFLIKRLGWKKFLLFSLATGAVCVILFLPFVNKELIANLFSSIDLYFQKFEFNASIYYFARWVGYRFVGYNIIQLLGPILAIITLLAMVIYAIIEKQQGWNSVLKTMLIALSVYFLLATTVHPWYLTTLVAFSVFANLRYAVFWSAIVILSYSAYLTDSYSENLWLVVTEYLLVTTWLVFELLRLRKLSA